MKRLYTLFWLVLTAVLAQTAAAQKLDSVISYQPGFTGRIELGANLLGPLRLNAQNVILPLSVDFVQRFTTQSREHPALGIHLQAIMDPTPHRMIDVGYARYTLMQTGRLGTKAELFLEGSPVDNLSLNVRGGAGLRFYPLFDDVDTPVHNWRFYDMYEQLLLYFGGGFAYRLRKHTDGKSRGGTWGQLTGSLDYQEHRQDFSTRTEEYYRQNISTHTRFASLQAQLRFTTYVTPKFGIELAGNWYGRPSNDPQTKFYDARLGLIFHCGKQAKGQEDSPESSRATKKKQAEAISTIEAAAGRTEAAAGKVETAAGKVEAVIGRVNAAAGRAEKAANEMEVKATAVEKAEAKSKPKSSRNNKKGGQDSRRKSSSRTAKRAG
jgi:hypothetical protein